MSLDRRRIDDLEREVRRLRQEIAQRPIKPPKGSTLATYTLSIIGGNTLSDGVTDGIVWESGGVLTVPSAYNPAVDTSFIDGIGRASLYVNYTYQGTVLVAHYAGNGSPLTLALFADDVVVTSAATISVEVSGGGGSTVTCYVPYTP